MINFYCVQSPLQLISAISAAKKFHVSKKILLVRLSNGNRTTNDQQILDLVDISFWDEVIYQKKRGALIRDLCLPFRLQALKRKYGKKVDKYFFGEYRDFEMALIGSVLQPSETILLDDGGFTITAQNCYIRQQVFPFTKKLKRFKYFFYRRYFSAFSVPNLYSFFDLPLLSSQINYHDHSFKRRVVSLLSGEIYFFGSKFFERRYMTLENELSILAEVSKRFASYRVSYIPHRDECDEKLAKIKELGFEIKNLGKPAELFFQVTDYMPEKIVSYFSTVLYTCDTEFENVDIVSVDVRQKLDDKYILNSANSIYDYYKDIGFKLLNV